MSETNPVQPSASDGLSRRDVLRNIAMALTVVGTRVLDLPAAQHVHAMVRGEVALDGDYTPKYFNDREYKTLRRLAELIIPADEGSGSALDAKAPEFIDLLAGQNEELARIYISGMLWLDHEMRKRYSANFIEASEGRQIAMLDELAGEARKSQENYHAFAYEYQDFTSKTTSPVAPGVRFFEWVRRMTVDAFYTSEIGIDDVGFKGNGYRTEYSVPEESITYALKRSPFRAD